MGGRARESKFRSLTQTLPADSEDIGLPRRCRAYRRLDAVGLFPGDYGIAEDANFFDFTFDDVPRLDIPGLRIATECRDAGNSARGNDVACAIAHGRIVTEDFPNFHG